MRSAASIASGIEARLAPRYGAPRTLGEATRRARARSARPRPRGRQSSRGGAPPRPRPPPRAPGPRAPRGPSTRRQADPLGRRLRAARGGPRAGTGGRRTPAWSRRPRVRGGSPGRRRGEPARRAPRRRGRSTATASRVTRAPRARLPTAASSGRALTQDSSISSSGSESQTIPPPTHRWMRPAASAKVRIVSARSKSPFGWIVPSAPIEAPRPTGSSAAIRSTAAIFGAPVIEPPGKVARRISGRVTPSRRVPSTVETRWATPASCASAINSGQRTEPGLAHAREVVSLEVDDHRVLGRVLLGSVQVGGVARAGASP